MANLVIFESISREELSAIVSEAVKKSLEKAQENNFLSRQEFRKKMGVCLPTLDAAIKRGEIQAVRIGKRVLIRESELSKSPYLKNKLMNFV